jgi:PAS domain-containing protein
MAAPQLHSAHPGLKLIAEVSAIFTAGFASEDALAQVVGVLRRGLALRRCRLWRRHPTGSGYTPVNMPGDEAAPAGLLPPIAEWIEQGPRWDPSPVGALLRLPLVHESTSLGLLEAIVPEGRAQGVAHDVLVVVAQILAPVIAGTELSQDLASEVALRTREVDAQRGFAAKIIDSLPVGLYVIDRSYRIRAWNRKRGPGPRVSREKPWGGRFRRAGRQPRSLLRGSSTGFDTGEIQQMEMESQRAAAEALYRITKIPAAGRGRHQPRHHHVRM